MGAPRWVAPFRLRNLRRIWPTLLLGSLIFLVRWSKGAGFADVYWLVSRPFWPGPSQQAWIDSAVKLEHRAKLQLLQQDNQRLRALLSLDKASGSNRIPPNTASSASKFCGGI